MLSPEVMPLDAAAARWRDLTPSSGCRIRACVRKTGISASVVSRKYTREVNHLQGLKPASFHWLYVRAEALTPKGKSEELTGRNTNSVLKKAVAAGSTCAQAASLCHKSTSCGHGPSTQPRTPSGGGSGHEEPNPVCHTPMLFAVTLSAQPAPKTARADLINSIKV